MLTVLLAASVLGAAAFAACGGSSTTTEGDGAASTAEGAAAVGTEGSGGEKESSNSPAPRPDFEGSDETIEEFGSEAEGSDKEAVLSVEQGYLETVASGDLAGACAYISSSVARSLEAITGTAGPQGPGCEAILLKLLSNDAPAVARRQLNGEVARVRVDGDRAFVIFRAPGARLYVFPLVREGGDWKVSTLTSSVLSPSAATLGE